MRTSVGSTTTSPGLAGVTTSRYPHPIEFEVLGRLTIEPVPVPADCTDGFTAAYWRRPNAYLDEAIRANMSTFACSTVGSWPTVSLGSRAISPIAPGTAATPHC